jgi:ABC-type multidrug transport system fused ATPase/permease subunit
MKDLWLVFRGGVAKISPLGKRILYAYGLCLFFLAGLDGAALYFVSQVLSTSGNSNSVAISSDRYLPILIIVLFALKSIISTFLSYVVIQKISLEEVRIGSENFSHLMNESWNHRVDTPVTDLYNAVDRGPNSMVHGVLINVVTIISEAATAVVILVTLLLLQPATALMASLYFALIAVLQHKVLSKSSSRAGKVTVQQTNGVYEILTDSHSLSKLLGVSPSQSLSYTLETQRTSLAMARGRVIFLGLLPRYFMELTLVLGIAVIAGGTYALSDPEAAISAVAVFAAAGFRLLPIVNRIQGIILQLFSTAPSAHLSILTKNQERSIIPEKPNDPRLALELQNVSFRYTTSELDALTNINLSFISGFQYAIVGPSGAGKTTLVDICLGLLQPQEGTVHASSATIAYVPQDTHIARLSLQQNIALEWNREAINVSLVDDAIKRSQLTHVLDGRSTAEELSDQGLSGGQKQRIGLARAMYRNPSLLFLDEVTSALDAETEHAVMSSIESLRGTITVVIVAHRLSTVQHADQVIYIDSGRVLGVGTFDELRKTIPQLQRQIELGTLDLLD